MAPRGCRRLRHPAVLELRSPWFSGNAFRAKVVPETARRLRRPRTARWRKRRQPRGAMTNATRTYFTNHELHQLKTALQTLEQAMGRTGFDGDRFSWVLCSRGRA